MNNPWLGLRSYEENDRIYGRDKEKVQLASFIQGNLHTIIYGKSGVGKSSLLKAGVFPLLRDDNFFPVYIRLEHNSEKSYLEQIIDAVMKAASPFKIEHDKADFKSSSFQPQGEISLTTLNQFLATVSFFDDDLRCRQLPVLVFDQFEEIFTLTDATHKPDVAEFFDQLADVLGVTEPAFRIVLCLREDYLYYLEQNSVKIPDLKRNRFSLKALSKHQATEIITKPRSGIVADDVVERILNKVSLKNADEYEPAILSLFMFSLYEKMKQSGGTVISKELVDVFGDNIISEFYNDSTKTISDRAMEFLEEHLLTDGGFRHNIPVDDAKNHGLTSAELKQLVDSRIVTITPRANNIDYMEFSHDVLCAVAVKSRNERRNLIQKKKMRIMAGVIAAVLAVLTVVGLLLMEMSRQNEIIAKSKAELEIRNKTIDSVNRELEVKNDEMLRQANNLAVVNDELKKRQLELEKGNIEKVILTKKLLGEVHNYEISQFELECQKRNFMKYQSKATSGRVCDNMDSEDVELCIAALLEVLPETIEKPNRPLVGFPIQLLYKINDNQWGYAHSYCHDNFVRSAEFSQDCCSLLTISDSTAIIWDVNTGERKRELNYWHKIISASFSYDGRYVITAVNKTSSANSDVIIWDANTGDILKKMYDDFDELDAVSDLSNKKNKLEKTNENSVEIDNNLLTPSLSISNESLENKPCTTKARNRIVKNAFYSPDGRHIVTVLNNNAVEIWGANDIITKKTFELTHNDYVNNAEFSHNSHYLVTTSNDSIAKIWDVESGDELMELKHNACVNFATFSADNCNIATVSKGKTVQIWDLKTEKLLKTLEFDENITCVKFSPDGRFLALASGTHTITWDFINGQFIYDFYHKDNVNSVSYSSDCRFILTASDDKTAKIWDVVYGNISKVLSYNSNIISIEITDDAQRIAIAFIDGTIKLLSVCTGQQICEFKQDDYINSMKFSHGGRYIVTASDDKTARIWNAVTGEAVGKPMCHDVRVNTAELSLDGRFVVTTSRDYTARIWDAATGEAVGKPMRHDKYVKSAEFSPDGRFVVTASDDNTTRIWDAATGEAVGEPMRHDDYVYSAEFSPDGRYVLTASWDNTARIWDAATGEDVGEPMRHDNHVCSAEFSPDGRFVVTASWDHTARIWDAATGEAVGEPMRHDHYVSSAEFSPDGRYVVTASNDHTVKIWHVDTQECIFEEEGSRIAMSPDMKTIAIARGNQVIIKPFIEPQQLINECREVFKYYELSTEDRKKYYLE